MTDMLDPNVLTRHARRLLETLAADGASGRENAARPGFLAVAAPKSGITTVLASLPESAAEALIGRRFAVWRNGGLHITDDGRTYLRRLVSGGTDPFATQHRELSREQRDAHAPAVSVDAGESPLTWLARRRDRDGKPFLETAMVQAGERFRRDVTVAQLLPSVTTNWSAHGSGGRSDPHAKLLPSEAALAARQRLERALDSVGEEFGGLLLDACGFVKKLEAIESERGWPARSAKVVLRMALAQLARHYGLSATATGPRSSRGLRHWGVEGFRPTIAPGE